MQNPCYIKDFCCHIWYAFNFLEILEYLNTSCLTERSGVSCPLNGGEVRGEYHQAVNPRQDMEMTTRKSETEFRKESNTEPKTNIKLKGGAEV